jgi:hypothetical protein
MVEPAGFVEPAGTGGGEDHDIPKAICSDNQGNVYTVGFFGWHTAPEGYTVDFALDWGSNDEKTGAGSNDVFITKIGSQGEYCWTRRIGGAGRDCANAVCTDADGNVYVAGYFADVVDFGEDWGVTDVHTSRADYVRDAFITKIDADGGYCWSHTLGTTVKDDMANGVCADSAGNVYVTGSWAGTVNFAESWGGSDIKTSVPDGFRTDSFITKIGADGNYCWTHVFGDWEWEDTAFTVCVDPYDNVYVAGIFTETPDFAASWGGHDSKEASGVIDIFVTKIDSSGGYCWTKQIGGPSTSGDSDIPYDICSDATGNIYLIGTFEETVNFAEDWGGNDTKVAYVHDMFITRINADASYGWTHKIGEPYYASYSQKMKGICADGNGAVYIAGGFRQEVNFAEDWGGTDIRIPDLYLGEPAEGRDAFITKLTEEGDYVWTRTLGGAQVDSAADVCVTPSGHVWIAGFFNGTVNFAKEWEGYDIKMSMGKSDIFITELTGE